MICGGGDTNETSLSCLNFSSNTWDVMTFKLKYRRNGHVSWQSKRGMVFIGGIDSTQGRRCQKSAIFQFQNCSYT